MLLLTSEIREWLIRNGSGNTILKTPMKKKLLILISVMHFHSSPWCKAKGTNGSTPDVCFTTRDCGHSDSSNFINSAVPVHWLLFCMLNCWGGGINKQLHSQISTVYCQINKESDTFCSLFITLHSWPWHQED